MSNILFSCSLCGSFSFCAFVWCLYVQLAITFTLHAYQLHERKDFQSIPNYLNMEHVLLLHWFWMVKISRTVGALQIIWDFLYKCNLWEEVGIDWIGQYRDQHAGLQFVSCLHEENIVPVIKVDKGLVPLSGSNNEFWC